ncbi:hypothetical protein MMC13_000874 [Lambiella insularis]|nr:hypothetical protein [Lambiella insularis]
MAFGLPLGFLVQAGAPKSAQTVDGDVDQLGSPWNLRLWKRLAQCFNYLARATGASFGTNFQNIAIDRLRNRLKAGPRRSRWLGKDNTIQLNALMNYNIPFSTGPQACLGRHLAIVELQIFIASLVRRFDMEFEQLDQELLIFEPFQPNPGPLPVRLTGQQIIIAG